MPTQDTSPTPPSTPPCCTADEAWAWVLVMADDALHGHASPNLLARAVAHWLAVQR